MTEPLPFAFSSWELDGYGVMEIAAGPLPPERIVPPAGEDYAFTVPRWRRRVQISVSPTGKSVRVWVDGKEVKP